MASFSLAGLFPTNPGLSPHRLIILPPVLHRSSFAISFLHPLLRIGTHFVVEFPCGGVSRMCPPTRKKSLKNGSKTGKWKRRGGEADDFSAWDFESMEQEAIDVARDFSQSLSRELGFEDEDTDRRFTSEKQKLKKSSNKHIGVIGVVCRNISTYHSYDERGLAHQYKLAAIRPPTFVFFVNDAKLFPETYRRYMEKQLRKDAGYPGTPIRLLWRSRRRRDKGKLADTNSSASTNEKMLL